MHDALCRPGLNPTERNVLVYLAKHDGPGRCRVKQSTVAADLEIGRSTVERVIASLKAKRLIEVHRSRRTAWTRVRYTWERELRSLTGEGSRSLTGEGSKEKAPLRGKESGSAGPEAASRSSPSPATPVQRGWSMVGEAKPRHRWLTPDAVEESKGLSDRIGPIPQIAGEDR